MTRHKQSSIGMKFLLVTGLFSAAFSVFLIYQTRQASYMHLHQIMQRQTELAMAFDSALTASAETASGRFQPEHDKAAGFDPEEQVQGIFDRVRQRYSHRMLRAKGAKLKTLLQTAEMDEGQLRRQLEQDPSSSINREIELNGQRYIARFVLDSGTSPAERQAGGLKMIAVPVNAYQRQIDAQIACWFQVIVVGLLILLAVVYGIYQMMIGRHLKRVTRHLRNAAAQDDHLQFKTLDIQTRDEFGLIADSYNQLCSKLQTLCRTLESQVQERTSELRQANKNLRNKVRECQHAEAQATILAHEAMTANRAKSEFLANMSHEIRTPMNAIMGFSEILVESELSEEPKSYVKLICESSQMLLQLIKDILDFSKIESGKLRMDIDECHLGRVLGEVESMMRPNAIRKGIRFEVLQCDIVSDIIRTDRIRLRQCLVNLISNAIKFTSEGHVYVSVTSQEIDGECFVRFDVEDTGIGIPEEKMDVIFDSFTQADSAMTRKYGGTGLGLAITRKLCDLMGASLSVRSEINKGSVFSLTVPMGVSLDDENAVWNKYEMIDELNELSQGEKGMNMYNGKILVAEDNPSNQKLITILLQKMGLEVALADDGQSALDKCQSESFDLILMDMQMPNMNGYEATRQLRSQDVTTPIIAVTANAMMGDEEKCLDAGCDGYISKPIDRTKLTEIIGQYLKAAVG